MCSFEIFLLHVTNYVLTKHCIKTSKKIYTLLYNPCPSYNNNNLSKEVQIIVTVIRTYYEL